MGFVALAASIAASAHAIYQGVEQARGQKQAARQHQAAIERAQAAAVSQARHAEMAQAKANRKQPDTVTLLGAEMDAAKSGQGSTMLTGPSGAKKLGGTTLLGE